MESYIYSRYPVLNEREAKRRRPTHAVINLQALRQNYRTLKAQSGGLPLMAVVKANAYGHGLTSCAQALVEEGVAYFGVGFLEEGIELRQAGISTPVLVLGGAVGYQAELFLEYDLDLTISSLALARKVAQEVRRNGGKRARVHLKIDTGMGRIGVNWANALPFLEEALSLTELEVVGVYSHLAAADEEDHPFTATQVNRFYQVVQQARSLNRPIPYFHIANTGAVFFRTHDFFNLIRVGISLYGCTPAFGIEPPIALQPVMSLISEVVFVKRVPSGTPISYGCTWEAPKETTIATIPLGYGDGYPRALSNKGEVLIRGQRLPIVGRLCMDQLMVDAGDLHIEVGDPVVLIGAQGNERISAEEVASWLDTIPYEVTTQISARVPRVYLDGEGEGEARLG